MIPISQRVAGGGIAIWRDVVNGLARATRKSFRVGVDGDLTRYPAESHGCAMTEGVVFRLTQGGTAGVFFALVPAFIGRDKGFFVSAERER